jgi:hypothetical protein
MLGKTYIYIYIFNLTYDGSIGGFDVTFLKFVDVNENAMIIVQGIKIYFS